MVPDTTPQPAPIGDLVSFNGQPATGKVYVLWEACSEPERPTDPYVTWKPGCRACLFKARVLLKMYPGDPVVERHVHGLEGWFHDDDVSGVG